jgi:hypothetical protein
MEGQSPVGTFKGVKAKDPIYSIEPESKSFDLADIIYGPLTYFAETLSKYTGWKSGTIYVSTILSVGLTFMALVIAGMAFALFNLWTNFQP